MKDVVSKPVVPNTPNNNEPNLLGKLTSLVVLLGVGLYFTGWTYRWAYFGFFQVEVTTLNLPIESFYIAAFQALFGHPWAICRTAIATILIAIAIHFTLWIIQNFIIKTLQNIFGAMQSRLLKYAKKRPLSWIAQQFKSFADFSSTQFNSIAFLGSLVTEIVIVLWILTALFWLAQWQADSDAWADAVNETSTLPVVTFVTPKDNAALGRQLDNPLVNPSNFSIIGDKNRYENLLGRELSDTSKPEQSIVWRLLIDRDGYFYIFPALPQKKAKSDPNLRPPVLMIYESDGGDQLLILSPKIS